MKGKSDGGIEAVLSQLRDAADAFELSANNIRSAASEANGIVSGLMAAGYQSPAANQFQVQFARQSGVMEQWPDQLSLFARKLREAADDIEESQKAKNSGVKPDDLSGKGPTGDSGPDSRPDGQGNDDNNGQGNQGQGNNGQGNQGNQGQGNNQGGGQPPENQGGGNGNPPDNSNAGGNSGGQGNQGQGQSGTSSGGGVGVGVGVVPPGGTGGTGSSSSSGSGGNNTGNSGGSSSDAGDSSSTPPAPPAPADPDKPAYLSGANTPVYQELASTKAQIDSVQNDLNQWTQTRDDRVRYLEDMRARHEAMGGNNPGMTEAIRSLENEVAELDRRIVDAQGSLLEMQDKADALRDRLDFLNPGPNADLNAIAALEHKVLPPLKDEYGDVGCVRYVMDRMPIPPEIARNAHQWDDNPAALEKFGIKIGNEPMTGSVIVMEPEHEFGHDVYGHVMYVERVDPNGDIWVTDNNFPGQPRRLQDLTDELSGPHIKYMYFPWETKV